MFRFPDFDLIILLPFLFPDMVSEHMGMSYCILKSVEGKEVLVSTGVLWIFVDQRCRWVVYVLAKSSWKIVAPLAIFTLPHLKSPNLTKKFI